MMARKYLMSWKAKERRWRKLYRGVSYTVSCRQLGTPETMEGSWREANEWFERERDKAVENPSLKEEVAKAEKVRRLIHDFHELADENRRRLVDLLLGKGAYDGLKARRDKAADGAKTTPADKTIKSHVESWVHLLHGSCLAGQLSASRYHGYSRDILSLVRWLGPESSIDRIDGPTFEGFFNHLTAKVASKEFSPSTAHIHFVTAKQFISWLAERGDIIPPTNMRSKRMRFNHGRAAEIKIFEVEEVREILKACDESEERTKLYILLMLNAGMYQSDIADMTKAEVDWNVGLIKRARSKTKDRGGPVVTHRLWPETFHLLVKHRAEVGPLALLDDDGRPVVERWIENGKLKKRDLIDAAWRRVARSMGSTNHRLGMKHLRKTSASILGTHPQFKYYAEYFLAHSPQGVANRHYVVPSEVEFAEAVDWLRGQILGPEPS
ncbi:MAG: tyrosine-type recombinase/integrase [Paludisphaera borealis]|uniref:tyrosine-type recombinase/integrase n=1 Tax=Paludisphaera borealis TaxID=1387353 RepID=UPI002845DBBD|nr:tyrosine-type recombinase/integrase [Paludisphaera borealis]MDR3618237.1 tyrosine-type recombinase/integrase [Paludisphaera borealis]